MPTSFKQNMLHATLAKDSNASSDKTANHLVSGQMKLDEIFPISQKESINI